MPQPPQYTRITDFSTDEANNLTGRSTVRTPNLDTELDNVKLTLDQILTNIGLIQRDDGKLLDGVVTQASLSSAVTALFVAIGANPRGAWLTSTVYAVKDIIETGSPVTPYMCVTAHTSGVFATDYAANRWVTLGTGLPTASQVSSTATGDVAATNVQSAIAEISSEKVAKSSNGSDFANISTTRDNLAVFSRTEDQTLSYLTATATGTFDAITAAFTPVITALTNGQVLYVRAIGASTVTNPTFTPNSGTVAVKTIKKLNNIALNVGDIYGSSHVLILQYNLTVDAWFLLNPAGLPSTFGDMTYFTQGIGPSYTQNISAGATVATNALTLSLLTKAGATPTATDKTQIEFRHGTLTTGQTVTRESTAAATLVIPDGATLGAVASATINVYQYEIDNAGTIETAGCGTVVDEGALHSTTAISTASDSGNVLYSTTARTNVPVRLVARHTIQHGAVLGQWPNAPTVKWVCAGLRVTADQVMYVRDEKGFGSNGTGSVSGLNIRVLNTVVSNTIVGASIAGNNITLTSAGTYNLYASAPCLGGDQNKLYHVVNSVNYYGANNLSPTASVVQTYATLRSRFTVVTPVSFTINHQILTARATDGLGAAVSAPAGSVEIYTEVWITKE